MRWNDGALKGTGSHMTSSNESEKGTGLHMRWNDVALKGTGPHIVLNPVHPKGTGLHATFQ